MHLSHTHVHLCRGSGRFQTKGMNTVADIDNLDTAGYPASGDQTHLHATAVGLLLVLISLLPLSPPSLCLCPVPSSCSLPLLHYSLLNAPPHPLTTAVLPCGVEKKGKKKKKHQPQASVKGRAPFCRNTQRHTWLHIWLRPLIFALYVFACSLNHSFVNKWLCPVYSILEFTYLQIVGAVFLFFLKQQKRAADIDIFAWYFGRCAYFLSFQKWYDQWHSHVLCYFFKPGLA